MSDETALDLFRRIKFPTFTLTMNRSNLSDKKMELVFGDIIEIKSRPGDLSEAVLDLIFQCFKTYQAGILIHVSTGNNFLLSLQQSKLNISQTPLQMPNIEARLKSVVVHNAFQLLNMFELLITTLDENPAFVLLESLEPIYTALESNGGAINSLVENIFRSMKCLLSSQHVIILSISSFRELKQETTLEKYWKEKTIMKRAVYSVV